MAISEEAQAQLQRYAQLPNTRPTSSGDPVRDSIVSIAGDPHWYDQSVPAEDRMQSAAQYHMTQGVQQNHPFSTVSENIRRSFPTANVGTLERAYEQERQMQAARRRFAGREPSFGERLLMESVPVASAFHQFGVTTDYNNARRRMEAGSPEPGDYTIIARHERLQEIQAGETTVQQAHRGLMSVPAMAGEAYFGGGIAGRIGLGAATTAGRAAGYTGRLAAQTALTPSMYAPQWAQRNLENRREPYDLSTLPPVFAHGMMATAVLGSLGSAGNSITGAGILPVAKRLLTRTATGMVEQQGIDIMASAVSELLPKAYKLETGYGLMGSLMRGEGGQALQHAVVQAVTFAAFSGVHEFTHGRPLTPEEATAARAARAAAREANIPVKVSIVNGEIVHFEGPAAERVKIEEMLQRPPEFTGGPMKRVNVTVESTNLGEVQKKVGEAKTQQVIETVQQTLNKAKAAGATTDQAAQAVLHDLTMGELEQGQRMPPGPPPPAKPPEAAQPAKPVDTSGPGQVSLGAAEVPIRSPREQADFLTKATETARKRFLDAQANVRQTQKEADMLGAGTSAKAAHKAAKKELSEANRALNDLLPRVDQARVDAAAWEKAQESPKTAPPADPEPPVAPKPPEAVTTPPAQARKPFLGPLDVALDRMREKMKRAGYAPAAIEKAIEIAREEGLHAPDMVTGFHKAETREPTALRAIEHAKETGEPGVYVEMDLANLGGVNSKLGNSGANEFFRKVADIIREEMHGLPADAHLFRHGGDEMSALVMNAGRGPVTDAMRRAHARIKELAKEFGLSDIEHPKHPGVKEKRGTGVTFGLSEIGPKDTPKELFSRADKEVETRKKSVAAGEVPAASAQEAASPVNLEPPARLPESTGSILAREEILPVVEKAGLTAAQKKYVNALLGDEASSYASVALIYGVSKQGVNEAVNKAWAKLQAADPRLAEYKTMEEYRKARVNAAKTEALGRQGEGEFSEGARGGTTPTTGKEDVVNQAIEHLDNPTAESSPHVADLAINLLAEAMKRGENPETFMAREAPELVAKIGRENMPEFIRLIKEVQRAESSDAERGGIQQEALRREIVSLLRGSSEVVEVPHSRKGGQPADPGQTPQGPAETPAGGETGGAANAPAAAERGPADSDKLKPALQEFDVLNQQWQEARHHYNRADILFRHLEGLQFQKGNEKLFADAVESRKTERARLKVTEDALEAWKEQNPEAWEIIKPGAARRKAQDKLLERLDLEQRIFDGVDREDIANLAEYRLAMVEGKTKGERAAAQRGSEEEALWLEFRYNLEPKDIIDNIDRQLKIAPRRVEPRPERTSGLRGHNAQNAAKLVEHLENQLREIIDEANRSGNPLTREEFAALRAGEEAGVREEQRDAFARGYQKLKGPQVSETSAGRGDAYEPSGPTSAPTADIPGVPFRSEPRDAGGVTPGMPGFPAAPTQEQRRAGGVGGGQENAGQPQQEPMRETALANAQIDREREARGLPRLMSEARRSNPVVWDAAMDVLGRDPQAAEKLVDELVRNPDRAINRVESALLLQRHIALKNQRDRVIAEHNAEGPNRAKTRNDPDARRLVEAKMDRLDAEERSLAAQIDQVERVTRRAGTETGGTLQFRRQLVAEDYSLQGLLDGAVRAKGSPLTEAERSQITDMAAKIKELQDKLAALEDSGQVKPGAPSETGFRLVQAKAKCDAHIEAWRQANAPWHTKAFRLAREAIDLPRSIMASIDFPLLRQGLVAMVTHPVRTAKAVPEMFRSFFSEEAAQRSLYEVQHRPNAALYEAAGLDLTSRTGPRSAHEEGFLSRLAEKIPILGHITKASERSYQTVLNRIRADSFDAMTAALSQGGKMTSAEAKVIANYVNVMTGRGDLGPAQKASTLLSTIFFAPKWAISRFQLLLGQPLYSNFSESAPRARQLVAKEYAKLAGGLGLMAGLAALAGFDMEKDPRSSNFGKLKVGNTRLDLTGGLASTARLLAQTMTLSTKNQAGKVLPLHGILPYGQDNYADILARFVRGKLAPAPGAALNLLSGTDVVGQPVTPASAAGGLVTPLFAKDVYEAMMDLGFAKGTAVSLLGLLGMSMATYNPNAPKPQRQLLGGRG